MSLQLEYSKQGHSFEYSNTNGCLKILYTVNKYAGMNMLVSSVGQNVLFTGMIILACYSSWRAWMTIHTRNQGFR